MLHLGIQSVFCLMCLKAYLNNSFSAQLSAQHVHQEALPKSQFLSLSTCTKCWDFSNFYILYKLSYFMKPKAERKVVTIIGAQVKGI